MLTRTWTVQSAAGRVRRSRISVRVAERDWSRRRRGWGRSELVSKVAGLKRAETGENYHFECFPAVTDRQSRQPVSVRYKAGALAEGGLLLLWRGGRADRTRRSACAGDWRCRGSGARWWRSGFDLILVQNGGEVRM